MNFLKYLTLWGGLILPTLAFTADGGDGLEHPRRMGFVRSPHNAVQLLGASLVRVDKTWIKDQLPEKVSLEHAMKGFGVLEQGSLGSCTANAASGGLWGTHVKNGVNPFHAARLPLYYWSREEMKDVTAMHRDSGASLYDVARVLRERGYCDEKHAPYDVRKFKEKPDANVEAEAAKHKVLDGMGVAWIGPDVRAAQVALANGLPVVFGMTIHQDFVHLGADGVAKMPTWRDQSLGGHAMFLIGYDAKREVFIGQNSWGKNGAKKVHLR